MGEIPEFAFDLSDGDTFSLVCPFCYGNGCDECGSIGIVEESDSAEKFFDKRTSMLLGDVIWFVEHGVLPNPNAPRGEQTSIFIEAVTLYKNVRAGIENMRLRNV